MKQAAQLLGRFISPKESANIRYPPFLAHALRAVLWSHASNGRRQCVNGRETLTLLDGRTTRYLGLEAMGKLALSMSEETGGIIKRHLETVLSSLKDPDISIRCVQSARPPPPRSLAIYLLPPSLLTLNGSPPTLV